MCLSFTIPFPTLLTSRSTFLGKTFIILDDVMFPIFADTIYLPGTSPTNLPSSKIKPEAELLLSNDFPVKEYSIGIPLSAFPFLSKAFVLN